MAPIIPPSIVPTKEPVDIEFMGGLEVAVGLVDVELDGGLLAATVLLVALIPVVALVAGAKPSIVTTLGKMDATFCMI